MEYLKRLMKVKNMTSYELSQLSGVSESAIHDILCDRSRVDRCSAGRLCQIANVLNTTVEQILDHYLDELSGVQDPQKEILHDKTSHVYFYKLYSDTFSVIHSHGLAYMVKRIKEDNLIREYYAQRNYRLALLLLGLTDYYHRTQDEAPDPAYHDLRGMILDHPVYSLHTIAYNDDHDTFERVTKHARRCAIPELARHNIYITEVEFLRMA